MARHIATSVMRRENSKDSSRKRLLWLAAAGGAGLAALGTYQVFCPRASLFGQVVTHGPRHVSAVSLIFDRSPSGNTETVCSRLHELQAPATFFVEGERALSNPRGLRALRPFDLGIHGQEYAPLIFRKQITLRHLLQPTLSLTSDLKGHPPRFLLPPFGWKDVQLCRTGRALGLTLINPSMKLCSRKGEPPSAAVARLLRRVQPGDIVLLPGGAPKKTASECFPTPDLLGRLVDGLRERGLSPWGLSALLQQA